MQAGFWLGNQNERDHLKDTGLDERVILKWIFKKRDGGMDWINLAQYRGMLRALVNEVMDHGVP